MPILPRIRVQDDPGFHRALRAVPLGLAALLAAGCGASPSPGGPPATPAAEVETSAAVFHFEDVTAVAGLDFIAVHGNARKRHLLESTGGGAALADFDDDGDLDLYVTTAQTTDDWLAGRRPRANALYRNNGNDTFTEVAAQAGVDLRAWSAGAYFADVDNDGHRDLFVTTWGPNVLYRNLGDGTFADLTAQAGVAGPEDAWSASAAFGDLDGDGDLDLYVTNYCVYDLAHPPYDGTLTSWKGIQVYRGPLGFQGQHDRLYRNDGDGTFTDVSEAAGILDLPEPRYGLGVVMEDLDGDGDLDIYVANDSKSNLLWRNDGGLRFTDIAATSGVGTNEDGKEQAGMGADAADYDGDGRPDLVVTNFSHDWHTLYRNLGSLQFSDETFRAGLQDTYLLLGWGVRFTDLDLDGRPELVFANGHIYPEVDEHPHLNTTYAQLNLLYRNQGEGRFENVTHRAGPGFATLASSRGLAVGDLDGDGDPDLVFTNLDGPLTLLRNDSRRAAQPLVVRLTGTRSNRDAVGARVRVSAGGTAQEQRLQPYGSYQSQSAHELYFGVPEGSIADVEVRWPSGLEQSFTGIRGGQRIEILEGDEVPRGAPLAPAVRR